MSWARIDAARAKPARLVVGLISGTSADGIDAVLSEIRGSGRGTIATTLAFRTVPYPDDVRAAVLGLRDLSATDVCRWNMLLGERFAEVALAVIAQAGRASADVDLVGSHGQTIVHLPRSGGVSAATLQIAEPCVIAERTGIPVVADFRPRDVAAGGEGAPLVPWVDWLTLRPASGSRLVQNLGGIANVTLVTQDPDDVTAFDTGPANGPIDAAVAVATGGARHYDEGGRLAAAGRVDGKLVEELLRDPWFDRAPPKSASRETWGEPFVAALAGRRPDLSGADLVATLTEFVARSVVDAWRRHASAGVAAGAADAIVSGGGVHNPVLMGRLRALAAPVTVRSSADVGMDPDSREALAFAVLANETVCGGTGNLPRVTGASRRVPLGKIVL
ncbi:MAG: anhydro-N-acetylmuramic acid kinase [Planctomycetes bacterium]|nr:anhydro-N-acetylmuramic acid kinase [Planctomycetota bacterium]